MRIARFDGIAADAAQSEHAAANGTAALGENELIRTARSIGLKARAVALRPTRLAAVPLPALVLERGGRHLILAKSNGKTALVLDVAAAAPVECIVPLVSSIFEVRADGTAQIAC